MCQCFSDVEAVEEHQGIVGRVNVVLYTFGTKEPVYLIFQSFSIENSLLNARKIHSNREFIHDQIYIQN